jgi:hypothetical protein
MGRIRKPLFFLAKKAMLGIMCSFSILFFTAGCFSLKSRGSYEKPVEHIFTVNADVAGWQDSGVRVKQNQVISCHAEGKWGNYFETYGPDGTTENIKTHHGVSAPAYTLLMRVSSDTNLVWIIGKGTSVVAKTTSGNLFFRSNISLTNGLHGSVKVYFSVADDDDGDGLSNYEEIYIWKTNPNSVDTNGNGFSDYEEVMERKRLMGLLESP